MSYRRISTADIQKPEHSPLDRGSKPVFDWLRIANLRVNEDYQRPLNRQSQRAITKIATHFSWIKFGALKVAPIADTSPQEYSIIDGQHRATAFAALAKSGDPEAVTLNQICNAGGVTILRYPVQASQMKPGQTIAVGTLKQMAKRYGRDVLVMALKCITETSNNLPGAVHANAIQALCEIIGGDPKTARDKRFFERFETIELDQLDSRFQKPRKAGDSARARLRDAIIAALEAQKAVAA
jgi:hypothetical protein